ncbi:SMC-Scp complex subunit ScpB [Lactobacillus corticis]|uniref:Segregation and condensation protein B n=1 Tax=Lactobacillus corticis TaxID=2201249 RepID=A0A916QGP9_9LACO|nr:SMC-Scp complex subunit ScpB [Lactobacillus corticis]GFZ26974.1 segregation and condensation protein ScpB [Lactobacillus corticis]
MATRIAEMEALLYVAGEDGLTADTLADLLIIDTKIVAEAAEKLNNQLKDRQSGLRVVHVNDKYKLVTSKGVAKIVESYFKKDANPSLSQSALEILAIVAYRQPITRIEIDEIRGVNSSGALQTLVWRGLVKIGGKKDVPGHPNLYVTTDYFLEYFGYESLADLPLIEDFEDELDFQDENVELFPDETDAGKDED